VFGSYGRGSAAFGSDLDLILVDEEARGGQIERLQQWQLAELPLSSDHTIEGWGWVSRPTSFSCFIMSLSRCLQPHSNRALLSLSRLLVRHRSKLEPGSRCPVKVALARDRYGLGAAMQSGGHLWLVFQ